MTKEYFEKHISNTRKEKMIIDAFNFVINDILPLNFNKVGYTTPRVLMENLLLFDDIGSVLNKLLELDLHKDGHRNINIENRAVYTLGKSDCDKQLLRDRIPTVGETWVSNAIWRFTPYQDVMIFNIEYELFYLFLDDKSRQPSSRCFKNRYTIQNISNKPTNKDRRRKL